MSKVIYTTIRKKGETWSVQIGTNYEKATIINDLPTCEVANLKAKENQLNKKARMHIVVMTKKGPISYEHYKDLVEL